MDVAYDRIQEEALPEDSAAHPHQDDKGQSGADLKTELGDAYKAFSDSSWGATIGGLWGTVRKRVGLVTLSSDGYVARQPYADSACSGRVLL